MRQITLYRVPIGFDWQLDMIWFGYLFQEVACELCLGVGSINWIPDDPNEKLPARQKIECPICKGTGRVTPIIEVPKGNGFQIWETKNYLTGTNEHHYYPISPVFRDTFELAEWMSKNLLIDNDPLMSESTWHDAIQSDSVDATFGIYRDRIKERFF